MSLHADFVLVPPVGTSLADFENNLEQKFVNAAQKYQATRNLKVTLKLKLLKNYFKFIFYLQDSLESDDSTLLLPPPAAVIQMHTDGTRDDAIKLPEITIGLDQDKNAKGIPNSTRTDEGTLQRYRKNRKNHMNHRHHHKNHRKRYRKQENRFTTEASIRRVAEDVVRDKEEIWRNQSSILRQSLNNQADSLSTFKRKLAKQEELWNQMQENDTKIASALAKGHRRQVDAILSLRKDLDDMHRTQELQTAAFRDLEMNQQEEHIHDEQRRPRTFMNSEESKEIANFLRRLNITSPDDTEILRQANGSNISNIFVFPDPVRSHIQRRHRTFLASKYAFSFF